MCKKWNRIGIQYCKSCLEVVKNNVPKTHSWYEEKNPFAQDTEKAQQELQQLGNANHLRESHLVPSFTYLNVASGNLT